METLEISNLLAKSGLKITPQRIAVLEAIHSLKNHPAADDIIGYIKKTHPNIAIGTIYKILETLVEKNLIKKVKTDKDIMRYDGVLENHHHLYCEETERVEDYYDDDLDNILKKHFENKNIPDFKVQDIKLQIIGKFLKK